MNSSSGFKALNILHKTLLAGQIIFMAVVVVAAYSKMQLPVVSEEMGRIFQVIVLLLAAGGFFAGSALFKKQLLKIREMQIASVKEKFAVYRSACILQWAFLEGPCLFSIICFFLTGNYAFIALAAVLILLFTMLGPVKLKIALQLGISEEELADL